MKKRKIIVRLVATALLALFALVGCVALTGKGSGPATGPPTSTAPAAPSTADALPLTGIGDEIRDGDFAFVVTGVQTGVHTIGTEYLDVTAQGAYTIVSVTVTNIGTEAQMFSDSSQTVLDAQGRKFSADTTAAVYLPGDSHSFLEQINPGNTVAGKLVFDLPPGVAATTIDLHDSPFSSGVQVDLRS